MVLEHLDNYPHIKKETLCQPHKLLKNKTKQNKTQNGPCILM